MGIGRLALGDRPRTLNTLMQTITRAKCPPKADQAELRH